MTPVRFHHLAVVIAIVLTVPFSAACSRSSGREAANAPGASSSPESTVVASATDPVTTVPVSVWPANAADLFGRLRTALTREGKVTHLTTEVDTEIVSPAETRHEIEEAWWDPTLPVVRVERRMSTESETIIGFLDSNQGLGNDEPTGLALLYLLATLPEAAFSSLPAGLTLRADVEDEQPVTVVDFQLPEGYESPEQTATLTLGADDLPLHEERQAVGQDSGWTTKTITYQTEFIDPATLPDGYFDATTVEPPPEPPVPGSSDSDMAAGLAQEGLPVRWLGRTYEGLEFMGWWENEDVPSGPAAVVTLSYASSDPSNPFTVALTETTRANWPAIQNVRADIASVETTGEPVPGIGVSAFLASAAGIERKGTFGALVVFEGDAVIVIDVVLSWESPPADPAELNAQLVAAAKALQPLTST